MIRTLPLALPLRALLPSPQLLRQTPLKASSYLLNQSRFNSTASEPIDDAQADRVKHVTVFGAGLMGSGIAQAAAQVGYNVVLADVTDKALDNGLQIIHKSLLRTAKKLAPPTGMSEEQWIRGVEERIRCCSDAGEAVQQSDLVVEAIVENLKIKQELFKFLDGQAQKHCIFGTNTSSLAVEEIGGLVSEERKVRFAGLHFFNPVPAMRLVEIIQAPQTSDETIDVLKAVTKRMRKSPVMCKDTPGFIVNRLLMPYLLDAVRMVERGEASQEDIDVAMELGAGYPMGPFKLLDFIGLDTTTNIVNGWREKAEKGLFSKEQVAPTPSIEKLLKEGRFGRKNGKGFYEY